MPSVPAGEEVMCKRSVLRRRWQAKALTVEGLGILPLSALSNQGELALFHFCPHTPP